MVARSSRSSSGSSSRNNSSVGDDTPVTDNRQGRQYSSRRINNDGGQEIFEYLHEIKQNNNHNQMDGGGGISIKSQSSIPKHTSGNIELVLSNLMGGASTALHSKRSYSTAGTSVGSSMVTRKFRNTTANNNDASNSRHKKKHNKKERRPHRPDPMEEEGDVISIVDGSTEESHCSDDRSMYSKSQPSKLKSISSRSYATAESRQDSDNDDDDDVQSLTSIWESLKSLSKAFSNDSHEQREDEKDDPWTAAKRGDIESLKIMEELGEVDWTKEDSHGNTPLYYACTAGGSVDISVVAFLLDVTPYTGSAIIHKCRRDAVNRNVQLLLNGDEEAIRQAMRQANYRTLGDDASSCSGASESSSVSQNYDGGDERSNSSSSTYATRDPPAASEAGSVRSRSSRSVKAIKKVRLATPLLI